MKTIQVPFEAAEDRGVTLPINFPDLAGCTCKIWAPSCHGVAPSENLYFASTDLFAGGL
ncbi:hypothetical protein SDC9_76460 [bioreactor metagenome]|uniref:Uncharacterized protein n=1 Tax=bioreactor metagenome TaxID=1076179 RepID=A0A644YPJ8_9ZZZZ|nr:hypothetical protein [Oscillibacter sp.]